jgi:hypothetical protein
MKPRNIKFFKDPNDILKNIIKLPDELVDIIYSYVPTRIKTVLSKNNYLEDHKLLRQTINKCDIENYIRTMIRQDNSFVFEQLLIENYDKWINIKDYYYKDCIHDNYLIFLESYVIDNESIKCKKILDELFEEVGFNKNQHKKKSFKYYIR